MDTWLRVGPRVRRALPADMCSVADLTWLLLTEHHLDQPWAKFTSFCSSSFFVVFFVSQIDVLNVYFWREPLYYVYVVVCTTRFLSICVIWWLDFIKTALLRKESKMAEEPVVCLLSSILIDYYLHQRPSKDHVWKDGAVMASAPGSIRSCCCIFESRHPSLPLLSSLQWNANIHHPDCSL